MQAYRKALLTYFKKKSYVLHSLDVEQAEPVSGRPSPYTLFDFNNISFAIGLLCMYKKKTFYEFNI